MLSRNAQGLYWMGRYLERAESICRLLRLQTEALIDRPHSRDLLRVDPHLQRHRPTASRWQSGADGQR